jgi:2-polyprenyl-3-methyl-5-hydroxy-6-metoxy-1,4-benzoquinol methylase
MSSFFQTRYNKLVDSPNGRTPWWHSIPLPDGNRISGFHDDKDVQFKMWEVLQIPNAGGLAGNRVLDIGASDGFFTLAAHMAGAEHVTAIGTSDWHTFPHNIKYSCEAWGVHPEIISADFRTHPFESKFDVIFFFGVLYHLEDVFGCMELLRGLLADQGTIYMETQITQIQSELPIFENASDIYPTVGPQYKSVLKSVGNGNFLFPNEHAIRNLAYSYDLDCWPMSGPHHRYTRDYSLRRFYKLAKSAAA